MIRHFSWLVILLGIAAPVAAVGTDPTLALTSVKAFAASSGVTAVIAEGTFGFDDLVQSGFPTGVVIHQGSSFLRYGADGTVRQGTSSALADGLLAAEVPALLGTGSPAAATARVVEIRADRISVSVPPGALASGAATVVIYNVINGEPFVSNSLNVVLP